MKEWITVPLYNGVTVSRWATPEDYALFARLFPEPRIKRPMACLAPVDTTARVQARAVNGDMNTTR